ncbi:MAG: class I SAM-dependent methyltransferase [Candidatus Latescibacterota bacterium]
MLAQRAESIRRLVQATYENPVVVARYVGVGLWPAEEILVLEHVPETARVLDLGCGAGRTSIALAEMGLQVTGIDLSPAMIEAARQQAELAGVALEFAVMDAAELCYAEQSFDVALFSYNGIELVPGLQGKRRVVEEVGRVLRLGGVFVFSSHALFALNRYAPARLAAFARMCAGRLLNLPVAERELGERFIDDPFEEVRYLQILPPSTWRRLLQECGFEVVLFNTRRRIEAGRTYSWRGAFEDGERFYVARRC